VGIGIPIEMNKLLFVGEKEVEPTPAPTPTTAPEQPCFEMVFAIAGLLTVAYLISRRKK